MGSSLQKWPKIILALVIQLGVFAFLWWIAPWVVPLFPNPLPEWSLWLFLLVQGGVSAILSCLLGLPCWWRWIQLFFPFGLALGVSWQVNPWIALGLAVLIWLVFANSIKERVPLYLSNQTTRLALKKLLKRRKQVHFLDLGSGLGGNVVFMAQQVNVKRADGVETAPLPYLVSKVYTLLRGGDIFAMDLWHTHLDYYDVVYAFLSPEPMEKLWQKVREEMRAGTVFVSNSFAVPDVEPSEVWVLDDQRQTKLYLYYL